MEEVTEYESIIPVDENLAAGVHIGTQQKTEDMKRFVYRCRADGLYVLDVKATDDGIKPAAKFLSKFDPACILVVSERQDGQCPATMFANVIRAKSMGGRFI